MKSFKHKHRRRGVLILIVLSILVMFGLLGITFVIIAGQAKRTATTAGRSEQQYDPPDRLAEEAALSIFRGSNNPGSPTWLHSLLEDIYGGDTLVAASQVPTIQAVCAPPGDPDNGQLINVSTSLSGDIAMRRVGCVLTMSNGPAAGRSTRIVGCNASVTPPLLQIVAFDDVPTRAVVAFGRSTPLNYVINGPAFTGTGVGYDPTTGRLTFSYAPNVPMALLLRPFISSLDLQQWLAGPDGIPGNGDDRTLPPLLANPDYTAADHQHPFLAVQLPNGQVPVPSFHRPELVNYWYARLVADPNPIAGFTWPSGLSDVQKWKAVLQPGNWAPAGAVRDGIVGFKRRILLRPLPEDNYVDVNRNGQFDPGEPFFTGSNPAFRPNLSGITDSDLAILLQAPYYWDAYGPWDVDTDGDGIPDAIWLDFGFPVRALPDGRLVKPLVAPLIVDLDGRLNVNAHGTYAQTDARYYGAVNPLDLPPPDPANYFRSWTADFIFSQSVTPTLPRGFGYGPAEINLMPLFGLPTDPAARTAYNNLLQIRYKPSLVPGSNNPLDDPLHLNKWWDYAGNYWNWAALAGSYGSPPNRLGDGAIGLDPGGRPLYLRMGRADPANNNDERLSDPYKLNLSKPTTVNTPFTPAELEAVLRNQPYEADAARLPRRLLTSGLAAGHAHEITTESWHVPAPTFVIPKHLLWGDISNPLDPKPGILDDLATTPPALGKSGNPTTKDQEDQQVRAYLRGLLPGRSVQDLVKAKIYVQQRRAPTSAVGYDAMNTAEGYAPGAVQNLLPLELAMRVKMDVNRPFGNARDDDLATSPGYGVVDDPWEALRLLLNGQAEQFFQVDRNGQPLSTALFHANQTAVPGGVSPGLWARQLYARHLYILMMTLVDVDKLLPPGATDAQKARLVAQWAVNVVDYRDRDSIMTPFPYDPAPFSHSGWLPSLVVWGCERPELLISEALALHDRRVENLPAFGTYRELTDDERKAQDPPPGWEPTFDQRKTPMPSLFVELYNPWTELEPRPMELYGVRDPGDSSDTRLGVQLNRTVTDVADGSRTTSGNQETYVSPVWRLVIVPASEAGVDPDFEDGTRTQNVDRSIYFFEYDYAANKTNMGALKQEERPDADTVERFYWIPAVYKGDVEKLMPVYPGSYAVIGPRGSDDTDSNAFTTYIGRTNATQPDKEPSDANQTRQIRLKNVVSGQWRELETDGTTSIGCPVRNNSLSQPSSGQIREPVATVGINYPRRLNISDPKNGYAKSYNPVTQVLDAVEDTPLDYGALGRNAAMATAVKTYGTTVGVATVHLQRLADPTRGYNGSTNPYRTIDSMPIDLTAFNGWDDPDITYGMGDPAPLTGAIPGPIMFGSRQRGVWDADPQKRNALWAQVSTAPPTTSEDLACNHFFKYWLRHSLGYLSNLDSASTNNFPANLRSDPTLPNLGDPNDVAFPWLNWNNRPFVSEMELLLVPHAKSYALLSTYGIAVGQRFPHLVDYFNAAGTGAEFYRVLDLVGVPSPFVGTEVQGKPDVFAAGFDPVNPPHTFFPPFNRIPNYREPGRLNVNTANSTNVWQGLVNDYFAGQSTCGFVPFADTRRGHNDPLGDMATGYPTRFGDPVRSHAGQMLTTPPLPLWDLAGPEVNATLLRSVLGGGAPLFASGSALDCNNPGRNPFFRYQGLQRLGNLVTTRSNVFAVWITVGYFEVQPWGTIDPAHPDGYMLGQEAGADRGDIKRHRAFYIFDRSIPMGFQRGMDLNVEKGVLLKRYIE